MFREDGDLLEPAVCRSRDGEEARTSDSSTLERNDRRRAVPRESLLVTGVCGRRAERDQAPLNLEPDVQRSRNRDRRACGHRLPCLFQQLDDECRAFGCVHGHRPPAGSPTASIVGPAIWSKVARCSSVQALHGSLPPPGIGLSGKLEFSFLSVKKIGTAGSSSRSRNERSSSNPPAGFCRSDSL